MSKTKFDVGIIVSNFHKSKTRSLMISMTNIKKMLIMACCSAYQVEVVQICSFKAIQPA